MMIRKIILLGILLLNLHPIFQRDGKLTVSFMTIVAQNFGNEYDDDDDWWGNGLPDVEIIGNCTSTCRVCGASIPCSEISAHESSCFLTGQGGENDNNDQIRCALCGVLLYSYEIGSHSCSVDIVGGSGENGGHHNESQKVIVNADKLDKNVIDMLNKLCYGGDSLVITSVKRTLDSQARAMLNNIKRYGLNYQLRLYKEPGKKVLRRYQSNLSDEQNIQNFVDEMNNMDPFTISHHLGDHPEQCTFDISGRNIPNVNDFINELSSTPGVTKVLKENGCIHVEYRLR